MTEFLKCDTEGCSHVEQVGTITADMVERPCPVCGSSLLTKEDWVKWSAVISPLLKAIMPLTEATTEDGPMIKTTVGLHNNKMTATVEKIDE